MEGRSLIEDLRWVAPIVLVVWPDCGQEFELAAGESVRVTGVTEAVVVGPDRPARGSVGLPRAL